MADPNMSFLNELFGDLNEETEMENYDNAIEQTLISAAATASANQQAMDSPLPPETPCYIAGSQHVRGDHAGPTLGATIPLSLSPGRSEATCEWTQESAFTRWPKDDAVVMHCFEATENLRGLQTVLALKKSRSRFLEEAGIFPEFNPTVARIEACRPCGRNNTFAFLQVTTRGYGFQKHDNAPADSTIVLTDRSYLALLCFFDREWQRVSSKMRSELQSMQEASCGVSICQGLSFYGSGVSRYQKLLESFGDFGLFVVVSVDSTVAARRQRDKDRIFVELKYKKNPNSAMPEADVKSLGGMEVPVEALAFLAGSREQLGFALNNLGQQRSREEDEGNKENAGFDFGNVNKEHAGFDFGTQLSLPSQGGKVNTDFAELASQLRHPVPEVELKMQSAASKILDYVSAPVVVRNQLTADEIKRQKGEAKKLAPPFVKQTAVSLLKSKQSQSATGSKSSGEGKKTGGSTVLATKSSLEELMNRGISDVSGERGYFTSSFVGGGKKETGKRAPSGQSKKRSRPSGEDKGDFKIPKNKKVR